MSSKNSKLRDLEQRLSNLEVTSFVLSLVALQPAGWRDFLTKVERARSSSITSTKPKRQRCWPHFVITSLFLRQCYPYLTRDAFEVVSYVSGPTLHGARVLDQLVPFKLAKHELYRAEGDIISSTHALISLCDRGFQVNGTIHSHPGNGETACTPSPVDLKFHQRLEQGGYQAVGIIMTRDGYVRFFSSKMPFTLKVIGKDVIKLGHNSYRLLLNENSNSKT